MPTRILSLLNAASMRDFYARGWWRAETIYDLVRGHAERTPQRFAIRDRYRRLTWQDMRSAADAFAAALHASGVERGDRVAFWLPDRIESVVAMLACSRNGYVGCPSPHRNHTVAEVASMLERMRAAAFVYKPGFGADAAREDIAGRLAQMPHLRRVWRLPPLAEPVAGAAPFAELLAPADAAPARTTPQPPPSNDPDCVAYLAFTSGSTGAPKGVMHSDNTLLVTARAICRDWSIDQGSVVCSLGPFSHNLGVGALMTALMAGAELVIHDLPRGESLVDRLTETGVTYLVGVPTHAIDLVGEMRRRKLDRVGKVRAFRVSGAASPPHVFKDLMEVGIEPQSGYGMTENNSHQYTRPGDGLDRMIGSCGKACDGYEIAILDPDDLTRRLPAGESGIVAGRGASLMLGYFGDQQASEQSMTADGWFMTGDLGTLDADGYLRLTGRRKELIIRGGHNINPSRIEDLAVRVPGIERAAAVPVPDPRLGERICLAIRRRGQASMDPHDLLARLAAAGLSRYELPEFVLDLDTVPLMANGKIDKAQILASIRAGEAKPVAITPAEAGASRSTAV